MTAEERYIAKKKMAKKEFLKELDAAIYMRLRNQIKGRPVYTDNRPKSPKRTLDDMFFMTK